MGADITIKQGEAKTIKFTVTDAAGVIDLSSATLKFGVKRIKSDAAYLIEKEDAAFDKTDAATGIVKLPLSATDTNQTPGDHVGELRVTFAADNIDKSADIEIKIDKAIIT